MRSHSEPIAEALGRGRNAMAIWHVDEHGFAARYSEPLALSW